MLQISFLTLSFFSALFVILSQNPVVSVFNLILLYIIVALYLMYLGITYIGISYIIIYIGAIAILFLFIIMMIDVEITYKKYGNYIPLLVISFITLIISIINTISIGYVRNYIHFSFNWDSAVVRLTQISILGDFFYSNYHVFIYILSIILLLAMVGAIILTKTHNNVNTTFIHFSFTPIILPNIELEYYVHFIFLLPIIIIFYFVFIRILNIKLPMNFRDRTIFFAASSINSDSDRSEPDPANYIYSTPGSHKVVARGTPLYSIYADPDKEYCRLLKEQSNIKERIADLTRSIHQADYLLWQKSLQRTTMHWSEWRYEELTDDIEQLVYGREVLYQGIDDLEKRKYANRWFLEKAHQRIFSATEYKWTPRPRPSHRAPTPSDDGNDSDGSVTSNTNKCDIGGIDGSTISNNHINNTNDTNGNLIYMENDMVMAEYEELPIILNILDNMKEEVEEISNNLLIISKDILNNFNLNYSEFSCDLEQNWIPLNIELTNSVLIGSSLLIVYTCIVLVRILMVYYMYRNIKNYHMLPSLFVRMINKLWNPFLGNRNGKMVVLLLPLDTPWNNFEVYFYVILILAVILWAVNLIFSLRILDMDKGRGFECGLQSFFQTREQFHISFHRVSLLFLAFDLEIVVIYPAGASDIHPPLFFNLLIFILILMVGFIYEISVNALDIFITDLVNNWSTVDYI